MTKKLTANTKKNTKSTSKVKLAKPKIKVAKSPKPNPTWISYNSNNSGGSWWLKDQDWKNLERNGWLVFWCADEKGEFCRADKNGRWLGALATSAAKQVASAREGIEEFERITGQDVSDEGCNCCGNPHNFTFGTTKTGKPPKNCYEVDGQYYSSDDFRTVGRRNPW